MLSFGPDGIDLELGPLNVLIGPNGSGKSNLVLTCSVCFRRLLREALPRRSGKVAAAFKIGFGEALQMMSRWRSVDVLWPRRNLSYQFGRRSHQFT